ALVDRSAVNVGTVSVLPFPPASRAGGGQVRRRPSAPRRGGVPVVVRGRESRPHGKGDSKSVVDGLEGQEDAGEYRRAVAVAAAGTGAGTGDPDQATSLGARRAG